MKMYITFDINTVKKLKLKKTLQKFPFVCIYQRENIFFNINLEGAVEV